MKHIISQFSLVVPLLCFSLCGKAQSSHEREESIPYGDFDKWMVRVIDESLIIGGRSKCLYEVAPADTVRGDIPYKSSSESPWRTSNVMARVSGVTKCSVSVFPEPRDSGYCVRLETLLDSCKVFGLFNIKVLVPGTIYMGQMMEPICDTKNPQSKLNAGVPFTKRPKAVVLDYKFTTPGTDHRIKSTGFSRQREVPGRDSCELYVILQKRWEDAEGNVYAKRVGTLVRRFYENTPEWINNYHADILYGDITSRPEYRSYMRLIPEEESLYCVNSRGESVPIHEVGWAGPDETPTHLVFRASSSCGEVYVGTVGNKFYLDNIRLSYDQPTTPEP